jgi:phosphatidylserine/phosphatidylglycerophosphate/cardiolipin synthase-like enzyme
MTIGLHSKHFIIDNQTAYVGSQNLYICDLAEWGIVLDHTATVNAIMEQYWFPLWQTSYDGTDVDFDIVFKTLDVHRDGEAVSMFHSNKETWKQQQEAAVRSTGIGCSTRHLLIKGKHIDKDLYLETTDIEDN